jgi:hypothetical protein
MEDPPRNHSLYHRLILLVMCLVRRDQCGELFPVERKGHDLSGIPFAQYYPYLSPFDSQCLSEKVDQLRVCFTLKWFGK